MQATAGHEIGAPRFAVWNSKSLERGRGICVTTLKPKRLNPSLVEFYVTPSPGVGWLQPCGRTTPVRSPFHPTPYWHCLSKPSPRCQVSTMSGQDHKSSPNWIPSPSPGHSSGKIPGHLLDGITLPHSCERLITKYTAAGD